MKLWDLFLYNGETDILRLRADTLRGAVHAHVIVEATETHTGEPKALTFTPELLEGHPFLYRAVGAHHATSAIQREAWQRNALLSALNAASAENDDLVLLGDVDEIPDPATLPMLGDHMALTLLMQQSTWDARNVLHKRWQGTVLTTVKTLAAWLPEGTRRRRDVLPEFDCGWHYTWMGSLSQALFKLYAFSHVEFANDTYARQLAERRRAGDDPFGREGQEHHWNDNASRPKPLWQYPERYPALWRDDPPRGIR